MSWCIINFISCKHFEFYKCLHFDIGMHDTAIYKGLQSNFAAETSSMQLIILC